MHRSQTEHRWYVSPSVHFALHVMFAKAFYDRVMVMDEGRIAEFDTVLKLFDAEDSIFRHLCDQANLSRGDILRIRANLGLVDI
jgi:ATP-binding cassette, subfamily C (CFTR/MRP), member 1